jgi:hypothetical protein
MKKNNTFLDVVAEFLAQRKGLLPIIGIILIFLNGIFQFIPVDGWVVETNILLHLGIIIAIFGFLVAWAL